MNIEQRRMTSTNIGVDSVDQNFQKAVDDSCFQLPNRLKEYISFYLTYNTEKRSKEDLLRLSAKNKYFTKDDSGYLAHKRCITNYVWPQLDDRQFDEIVKTIANRMDAMNIEDQTVDFFKNYYHQIDAEKQMMILTNNLSQEARRSTATAGFGRRPTFASQSETMPCRPSCSVSALVAPTPVTFNFEKIRTPCISETVKQFRRKDDLIIKIRVSDNDENNYCSYTDYAENDGLNNEKADFRAPNPIFEQDDFTEVPKIGILVDIEFESEICHVISPSEFYIRPYPSIVHNIQDELTSMMNNYECNSCPITKFSAGMYCTKSIEGIYKRFKILRTSVDTAGNNILIMIDIDSGARIWCGTRGLCPLPLQFRYYQQQAISCRLFGLAPSSNDNQTTSWPESVVNYFKQFCGPTVQANVLNVCEKVTDDGSFTVKTDRPTRRDRHSAFVLLRVMNPYEHCSVVCSMNFHVVHMVIFWHI